MALVLAIEPDTRQADIVKYIVRDLVRAELILVTSRDEAIAAIDQQLPDVILLTALLSPRDEDELISHLRRLGAAEHVQTYTIPLLSGARSAEQSGRGGGLLGKFRKKKEVEPIAGCDPEMFAAEIRAFLARADELKLEARESARRAEFTRPAPAEESMPDLRAEFTPSQLDDAPMAEPLPGEPPSESSWSSPFEWKSSYSASSLASQAKVAEANAQAEKARERERELAAQAEAERLKMVALEEEAQREHEKIEALRREADEQAAELRVEAEHQAAEQRREAEQREEQLRREAEEHRREAERLRTEAEAAAELALVELSLIHI